MSEQRQKEVLHILRNPHGHSRDEIRQARLDACDIIESLQDAYLNMRQFAQDNGLNTTTDGKLG